MIFELAFAAFAWSASAMKYCGDLADVAITGVAVDPKTNKFLYCEKHYVDMALKRAEVSYIDKSGNVFATKKVSYPYDNERPDIYQEDSRFGEIRSVKRQENMVLLEYKKNKNKKLKRKQLKLSSVDIIDAGFDHYVRANWDKLIDGQELHVSFTSVPHLQNLKLRVSKQNDDRCPAIENLQTDCFWVDIDNAFLRWFTPRLNIVYNEERRLVLFQGMVNIKNKKQKTSEARIYYQYREELLARR